MIATLIAAAILAWAAIGVDTRALRVMTVDAPPDPLYIAWSQHAGNDCTITVTPSFYTYGADLEQTVISHEVGHCLGFHHTTAGIMQPILTEALQPVASDLERQADLVRQQPRGTLPMVAA